MRYDVGGNGSRLVDGARFAVWNGYPLIGPGVPVHRGSPTNMTLSAVGYFGMFPVPQVITALVLDDVGWIMVLEFRIIEAADMSFFPAYPQAVIRLECRTDPQFGWRYFGDKSEAGLSFPWQA